RFSVLPESIENDSEQMARGNLYVGILRIAGDQITQDSLCLRIPAFPMQQERLNASRLQIARLFRQAPLNAVPCIVQAPFALEPGRQAQARVDGIGIGSDGALETAARFVRPPQALVLLSQQYHQ